MKNLDNHSAILVLEDDIDQMHFLVDLALNEIKTLMVDDKTSEEEFQKLKLIQILKATDIDSLQKTVSAHKEVLLAILDCNTPDTKGGTAHNQFVKTNHVITGQHKAVDIVTEHLPGTPITIVSSMNRFRTLVNRYYGSKYDLNIDFVPKDDALKIKGNINSQLEHYMKSVA